MICCGRILVADDDPGCLTLTARVLRQAGFECDEAPDAIQAAARLRENQYDLLVSDLEMPGNEGMRLIRDVPQIASGLPVILMTGYPTLDTAIESIHLPVAAYLVKPFENAKLLEHARRAVAHYQVYRAVRENHRRIQEWSQELAAVENSLKASRRLDNPPWENLLRLSLKNVTDAIMDLRVFAELTSRYPSGPAAAEATEAERPLLLLKAVRETIDVLEKTRSSFKSKELGELRKKLEGLVRE